jgi:ATP-dependent RNA helicase SUPV3L1/SUV3
MSGRAGSTLTAVLGPTNTGKTHLAVERMCGHASGMIGFPLRLLAREVYERVVAKKGEAQVALITGEEKILPPGARYFLCTAESMPMDREVAFVALDEAQMGADPERGHVFTDRLLHARGYAETMILGSATVAPLIRRLLPSAEVVSRPRFSTLSYRDPVKLSRLPRRSAIVAFTAEEVYALAEMLRRHRGGAAVVMGGLSPRTRNAQVELYQSGEVDHLVATDAIGMGLNMDITHVAFASLAKFDGRRHRRLRTSEMAQIAGRAGRHQRDGSFGVVQMGREAAQSFAEDEVAAIEGHQFPPITELVWRNARLDFGSLGGLIASLDERPSTAELVRAHDAIDLSVLKKLAGEDWVIDRARGHSRLRRLWAACSVPDYRKTGAEMHARLVGRIYRHLTEGSGKLPAEWIAAEVAHLDNVQGDIATISGRIAAARTWTYVAHRPGWIADEAHWAARTRALEDKLSDALHERLTQRFVDRRTSVLLRDLKLRGQGLAVAVDTDGTVAVEGEAIGTLNGFRFTADPTARAGEKRMLLAAAERGLGSEIKRRGESLAAADDSSFALLFEGSEPPAVSWDGNRVATLARGRDPLHPKLQLCRSLDTMPAPAREAVQARLEHWLAAMRERHLGPLVRLSALVSRPGGAGAVGAGAAGTRQGDGPSGAARGLIIQFVEALGSLPRAQVTAQLAALSRADRALLGAANVQVGVIHLFARELLRPEPTRWRIALWAAHRGPVGLPALPAPGRVTIEVDPAAPPGFYAVAGYWQVGPQAIRIDMVDRFARAMRSASEGSPEVPARHEEEGDPDSDVARSSRGMRRRRRARSGTGAEAHPEAEGAPGEPRPRSGSGLFMPDGNWVARLGISRDGFARLMRALGYRNTGDGEQLLYQRGAARHRPSGLRSPQPHSPFAVLAGLRSR